MESSVTESGNDRQAFSAPVWALWAMWSLSVAALCICGYLAWQAFHASEIAGCSGNGLWNCDHVLHSRWSKVAGLPVSGPAGMVYALMITCLVFASPRFSPALRQWAWGGITFAAFAAGAAALWFISLQFFVLQHLCHYCMSVHTIGLLLLGIVLWARPFSRAWHSSFASVAVLGVLGLITTQLATEPPKTYAIEHYEAPEKADDFVAGKHEDTFAAPGQDDQFLAPPTFVSPLEMVPPTSTVTPEPKATPDETATAVSHTFPDPSPTPLPQFDGQAESASQVEPQDSATASEASDEQQPASEGEPASDGESNGQAQPGEAAAKPADRQETYLGGRIRLNTYHWPIVGDPGADHVLVELFDYTCPHCRTMHQHLQVARQRFGQQVAILMLPVPLSSSCNDTVQVTKPQHYEACDLAKLAIAVWRVAPDRFEAFHDWLFEPPRPRTKAEALRYANQLVDPQALQAELAKPIPSQFIKQHVELYKRAGSGAVPKLLFNNITVKGEMRSADELIRLMERELKVR